MKRVFVVNPVSGNGRALNISKALKEVCDLENLDYQIIYTEKPGDAKKIALQFCGSFEETIVYSVGGDGTLNEVVNGIAMSNTILGVIPAGTGNDFYRMIEKRNKIVEEIDVGKVNDRYFINVASVGIDAKIANRANELKKKNLPNGIVYYLAIALELANMQSINLKIDDQLSFKEKTLLAVCNGKYYGNGMMISPSALLNDGMFDVYEVDKLNLLQTLKMFKLLLQKKHEGSNLINHYRVDYFNIESPVPLICNVDGEIMTDNKFVFENIESGIRLLTKDHPKIMSLHDKFHK
ncbi:MAG: diacylglycerol kinase family lipid kinase [Bacilli bacterium]|nr:diacylglycerol kinase family lipid kinase [Bacilli bacterium]MDD4547169.1 diacylglycerol kinase family lipid kinase [Bacilli bacterium]